MIDWMLATSARIGETLALRYGTNADGRPLLDLDTGTWEVNATVVRGQTVRRALGDGWGLGRSSKYGITMRSRGIEVVEPPYIAESPMRVTFGRRI